MVIWTTGRKAGASRVRTPNFGKTANIASGLSALLNVYEQERGASQRKEIEELQKDLLELRADRAKRDKKESDVQDREDPVEGRVKGAKKQRELNLESSEITVEQKKKAALRGENAPRIVAATTRKVNANDTIKNVTDTIKLLRGMPSNGPAPPGYERFHTVTDPKTKRVAVQNETVQARLVRPLIEKLNLALFQLKAADSEHAISSGSSPEAAEQAFDFTMGTLYESLGLGNADAVSIALQRNIDRVAAGKTGKDPISNPTKVWAQPYALTPQQMKEEVEAGIPETSFETNQEKFEVLSELANFVGAGDKEGTATAIGDFIRNSDSKSLKELGDIVHEARLKGTAELDALTANPVVREFITSLSDIETTAEEKASDEAQAEFTHLSEDERSILNLRESGSPFTQDEEGPSTGGFNPTNITPDDTGPTLGELQAGGTTIPSTDTLKGSLKALAELLEVSPVSDKASLKQDGGATLEELLKKQEMKDLMQKVLR